MLFNLRGLVSKLVWHEFGHLCMSLLLIEQNSNYKISKIGFTYFSTSRSWTCFVTCKNPDITDDTILTNGNYHQEFCLAILNNVAGAVFECVYWRLFEGNYIKPIELLARGSAMNDCYSLRQSLKIYNKEHEDGLRDTLVAGPIPAYFDLLLDNGNFTNALAGIATRYIDKITETFDDKVDFALNLNDEEIQSLSTEIMMLLDATGLKAKILDIKDSVSQIILDN